MKLFEICMKNSKQCQHIDTITSNIGSRTLVAYYNIHYSSIDAEMG